MTIYDDYVKYVSEYKAQYGEQVLVLMEVGSFWELYGVNDSVSNSNSNSSYNSNSSSNDARTVCDLLGITLTKRNKNVAEISVQNPQMAGFPTSALDRFLPTLLDEGYTVVLVSQVTPPPNPKREVTHVLSKGTCVFEVEGKNNMASETAVSTAIACVYWRKFSDPRTRKVGYQCGFACVDLTTGYSCISETDESNVDVLLKKYAPCELIVIGTRVDKEKEREKDCCVLTKVNYKLYDHRDVYDTDVHKLEVQRHIYELAFGALVPANMLSIHENLDVEKYIDANVALTYLLRFAYAHNKLLIQRINPPEILTDSKVLQLNAWTVEQLDIVGLNRILNRCQTAIGRRYCNKRIVNPFVNKCDIDTSLENISMFVNCSEMHDIIGHLKDMYDVERLFRKWTVGKLLALEINYIMKTIQAFLTVMKIPCMKLAGDANIALEIADHIQRDIDIENLNTHLFVSGLFPDLDSLNKEMCDIKSDIDLFFNNVNEKSGNIFKLESNDKDGWYLVVTNKRWKDFKDKDTMCFTSDHLTIECKEFEADTRTGSYLKLTHRNLKAAYEKRLRLSQQLQTLTLERLEKWLVKSGEKLFQNFKTVVQQIQFIDFYSCCARNAIEYCYVKPDINVNENKSMVKCQGLRHPIIERVLKDSHYVQNDVSINEDGILLYGLNAAGKSSLMKAVGLNIYMAQIGMFVPCKAMSLVPYERMFSRIGHNDNMYTGQSTFMVEMSQLREILKKADSKTIVLGDELCAGTENVSAIAIVSAALCALCEAKASFMLTTHLHELMKIDSIKRLVESGSLTIKHLHVEMSKDGTLTFDRELRDGQGSQVYGLEVCSGLGFPEKFLEAAFNTRAEKLKVSSYNSSIITCGKCEVCGASEVDDVHHIREQVEADEHGNIADLAIHKNHASNLVPLCKKCHMDVHHGNLAVQGYTRTSKGKQLVFKRESVDDSIIKSQVLKMKEEQKFSVSMIIKTLEKQGTKVTAYRIKRWLSE